METWAAVSEEGEGRRIRFRFLALIAVVRQGCRVGSDRGQCLAASLYLETSADQKGDLASFK